MCPYSEFFWSLFSAFGLNTDQKNFEYGYFSRRVGSLNSDKVKSIGLMSLYEAIDEKKQLPRLYLPRRLI